jgi:hypothetical protein
VFEQPARFVETLCVGAEVVRNHAPADVDFVGNRCVSETVLAERDDLQARLDTAGAGPTPDRESLERVVCGVEAALMALDGRDPSIDAAKNELAAALETLQQLADD